MKNIRPADALPLNSIITLAIAVLLLTACGIFSGGNNSNRSSNGNGSRETGATGWKVWVKTSPCAEVRADWISAARTNPTEGGGGSFWQTADLLQNPLSCTVDDSCTFAQAMTTADAVRASSRFTSYCCRNYSVWRNSETGRMSVVVGKFSTAGSGWQLEKGDMCCEEAEALSGITGACSGRTSNGMPPPPPLGVTPGITPLITPGGGDESVSSSSRNCWDCMTEERYCKQQCGSSATYGVPPSFGDQCEPKGFVEQCHPCWESKCKGIIYPKR